MSPSNEPMTHGPRHAERKATHLMTLGNKEEARGPWPSIQVLVAAANRKVNTAVIQLYGQSPCAVCQVPDDKDAPAHYQAELSSASCAQQAD